MEQPPEGDQQPQRTAMTVEQILDILQAGVFETEHGLMRWSSNYTFLVSLKHDDLTLSAVYKPQKGERQLWDFEHGTLCRREMASYLTSQELGWLLVPPTALRIGPRGLGSVQVYIDHDPEQNYFTFDENMTGELMRLAAFDVLINNADRKGGHCLLDDQDRLWGIDHGITFHEQNKLRTVIWDFAGSPVPEAFLADIERLCGVLDDPESSYTQELKKLLSAAEIMAFQKRIRLLLDTREYPQPLSSGPNYPWPPV
ncbi:MAG: SCO1664 family protein [Anaerolineaceae bacterium]|nr:SCO1664 family protein [Anaerolineaceae bacterium]